MTPQRDNTAHPATRNAGIRKANRRYAIHRTMHMSYHTTYTWKRRNSFKGSMIRDFFPETLGLCVLCMNESTMQSTHQPTNVHNKI